MVDLSVPAPELALSEQPRTQIDAAVFNRPLQSSAVAQGAQQLGSGAEDLADSLAKQKAQQDLKNTAVTLDANGVPQIATPDNSLILGRAGEDYNAAAAAGLKAMLASSVSQHLTDLHTAYQTDPQAFQKASQDYASALRSNSSYTPEVGNALASIALNEGAQRYSNIVEKTAEISTRENMQAVQTSISDTANKMRVIARQGGMGTPEYDRLQDQLQDGYDTLGSTKLFGYSPDRADSELKSQMSTMLAEATIGKVDTAFLRKGGDGGRAGAQKMLDTGILNNSELNLSDAERKQLYAYGMAHLEYLTSEQKANIDASRVTTDKIYTDLTANKVEIPDQVVTQAINQAQSVGDSESVKKLTQAQAVYPQMRALRGLSDEARVQAAAAAQGVALSPGLGGSEQQALDFFVSKGWSREQAAGIVGNLVRESGLNTAATNRGDGSDGSDSIGIGQWNGTRAIALKQFAAQQGRSPYDLPTQLAFVQHELETSEGNAARMLRGATDARSAASAFALGYERPQGFMTGDIAKVAGGADRVAAAVRLAGGGASTSIIAPSLPAGSSATVQPPTQAQMQANPFAISVYSDMLNTTATQDIKAAKAVGEAMATQFGGGNAPAPLTHAGFQQMAQRYPDQLGEIADKVDAARFAYENGSKALATVTPAAAQSYGDEVNRLAQGQDIFQQRRVKALQDFIAAGAKNLKEDMFGEGVRRNWLLKQPAPIDFTQPDTVPSAIQQHADAAVILAAHTQNQAMPMFSENELPALKSVMQTGSLDQRLALLRAITSTSTQEPVLKATLSQLADAKETFPLAVAGSLARDNPDAARAILQGQQALQNEPKLAPNKDDFPSEMTKAISFNDFPAGAAREGIQGAAQAYYAKLSADANDTTGVLNSDRMQKAIDAVTGGVVGYRGAKMIAPWYGAGQQGLDRAIGALTDADFRGAQTTDHAPFPAAALKPSFMGAFTMNNWRLQSAGDGKYFVFSGPDDNRHYVSTKDGGKFVLDLGAKREAAERPDLHIATPYRVDLYNSALMGGGN